MPDRYVVHRSVGASPQEVYALLAAPDRHQETEPTDWVRGAIDLEPLTEEGQIFGIHMFHENAGGAYAMHNRVIAVEPGVSIAWEPGQYEDSGDWGSGGWIWRYDLAPEGTGTRVTLTYDWSETPALLQDDFGLPPFGPEYLHRSLASLDAALSGG